MYCWALKLCTEASKYGAQRGRPGPQRPLGSTGVFSEKNNTCLLRNKCSADKTISLTFSLHWFLLHNNFDQRFGDQACNGKFIWSTWHRMQCGKTCRLLRINIPEHIFDEPYLLNWWCRQNPEVSWMAYDVWIYFSKFSFWHMWPRKIIFYQQ